MRPKASTIFPELINRIAFSIQLLKVVRDPQKPIPIKS
jgi:hypothetical protein